MKKFSVSLSEEEIQKLQIINSKNLVFDEFLEQIIREKINYIRLENGFFYNFSNKSIYNDKGLKINFRYYVALAQNKNSKNLLQS